MPHTDCLPITANAKVAFPRCFNTRIGDSEVFDIITTTHGSRIQAIVICYLSEDRPVIAVTGGSEVSVALALGNLLKAVGDVVREKLHQNLTVTPQGAVGTVEGGYYNMTLR